MGVLKAYILKKDYETFNFLNQKNDYKILKKIMKKVTYLGSLDMSLIFIMIVMHLELIMNISIGKFLILSISFSQLIVQGIKRIVRRKRPYYLIENIKELKKSPCKYSFPSGHTAAFFSIALVIGRFFPVLKVVMYILAILVGISRIFLGHHYPTDVVIGFVISLITYMYVEKLLLYSGLINS